MFAGLMALIFLIAGIISILVGFTAFNDSGGYETLFVVIALICFGGVHHFHFTHYTNEYHLPPILWDLSVGRSDIDSNEVTLHRSYISLNDDGPEGPGRYPIKHIKASDDNDKLIVYTSRHGIFMITFNGGGLNGAKDVSEREIDTYNEPDTDSDF